MALVVVALIVGSVWYLIGEERRMGRILSLVLTSKAGRPVTVERAWTDGSRIRARGVHLLPVPNIPLDIRIPEVEVQGGPLAFVAPAGRSVTIIASAPAIDLRAGAGGGVDAAALDGARQALLRLLDWPGSLTLRVLDGELMLGDASYRFQLSAEKVAGAAALALTLGQPAERAAARVEATIRGEPASALGLHLELAADPPRFGRLAPSVLDSVASVAGKGDVVVRAGGEVAGSGRVSVVVTGAEPLVVDFASRYDPGARRLSIPRWSMEWPHRARLAGAAGTETGPDGVGVRVTAKGRVEGSTVDGALLFRPASGAFEIGVTADSVDVRAVARHANLDEWLAGVTTVGALRGRVDGVLRDGKVTASARLTARGVRVPALTPLPVDAALATSVRSVGFVLERVETATLTLTHRHATIAIVDARSESGRAWPLAVDARVDDLAPLSVLLSAGRNLAGAARLRGRLDAGARTFEGNLDARLDRAVLRPGGAIVLSGLRCTLPIVLRGSELSGTGTLSVQRIEAFGLSARDGTGTVELHGRTLVLPDLRYAQYDGGGAGRLELALDRRDVPLRVHLEARRVDLRAFVREAAIDIARISGKVRYAFDGAYSARAGLVATGRIDSEEGGEVGIDAIRRLLDLPAVQGESTGLLRRTLETLRAFEYESLDAELRMAGTTGHVDLTLRGKKRFFGLFPGALAAINVRNMPLSLLVRTFAREGRR